MKPPADPFGLLAFIHWNHAWNNFHFDEITLKKSLNQLHDLGISMVRTDILWSDIHTGPGKYDFSRYDRIIAALEKKNIRLLGLLNYNKDYKTGGKEVWNRPPASNDEFADYVAATVERYKGWIKHWEIWNEPNHPDYWSGSQDGLKNYSALLKKSYAAAKRADPSCTVLNGGLTMGIEAAVEDLYREAGKDAFDALNIHPFINPKKPDAQGLFERLLVSVETVMKKHGDENKRIWITEIGCPGVPDLKTSATWFEGEAENEEEQAQWLQAVYGLVQKHPRIEKIFWAFYRDTHEMFKDATDYFGIVRNDLSPKPAYHALKKLIQASKTLSF